MNDKELKPCPFCGGKAKLIKNNHYTDVWLVMCTNCYSERLAHYEDLAEQGRLVELPCKIGDTIYKIPSEANYKLNVLNGHSENNRVYEQVVCAIKIYPSGYLLETCDGQDCVIEQFFKESWFLARSEAEQALAERKE